MAVLAVLTNNSVSLYFCLLPQERSLLTEAAQVKATSEGWGHASSDIIWSINNFSICSSSFTTFFLRGMSKSKTTLFLQTLDFYFLLASQVSLDLNLEAI